MAGDHPVRDPARVQPLRIRSRFPVEGGGAVLASLVVVFVLRYAARRGALPLATGIADTLGKARRLHDACFEKSDAHYQQELERIKTEFETTTRTVDQELKHTIARAGELRVACRMTSDGKAFRILENESTGSIAPKSLGSSRSMRAPPIN